jgi:hypothetical protein
LPSTNAIASSSPRSAARLDHAEGDVAGAAGKIEQRERPRARLHFVRRRGPRARRIDGGDERVLPGAVKSARHEIVHQVVTARHAVKNVVDQRLLVLERHLPEAEIGMFARPRHRLLPARP